MSSDQQVVARKAAALLAARVAELKSPRWTPRPHQVPPPGDWYGWLLLAGRGCVAPWTRIFDPTTGLHTPVEELSARGEPVTVLGLGPDGAVPVTCGAPFLKGWDEWIRFDMEDGSEITVTAAHLFLTPDGWQRADQLPSGSLLGCGGDRPQSSSGRALPESREGVRRWTRTAGDSTGRCLTWTRVVSRQTVGYGPYYDLQVPGVHSYLAEGIWNHNSGKTDACAEYMAQHVKGPPCLPGKTPHWMSIIAPTHGDAATSCVTGPSGIIAHDPSARMVTVQGGTVVKWPNGSQAKLFGASSLDDTERLRSGGNVCLAWTEELAAWRYLEEAWDQMRFGLRSGPRPRWIGSTTPKPRMLIKALSNGEHRDTVISRASTYDNPHLPQHIKDALEERYQHTQLGRQELMGLVIDEDENALWTHAMIDAARIDPEDVPPLIRKTVGVDPSGGAGEQGIVVAGKTALWSPDNLAKPRHHGFVLADYTCHLSPDGWGRRAVQAAIDHEADDITVEINYGRDMAVSTIRAAADTMGIQIPIHVVTATRGKRVRAEPVSALTEQRRWHHAGTFDVLEDQLCTWYPELDWSPDRLDAMVWDAVALKLAHIGTGPAQLVVRKGPRPGARTIG